MQKICKIHTIFVLFFVQKYLIDNITNASFFGMVINIKPADSNDLLEEGGQPNQDHGNLL